MSMKHLISRTRKAACTLAAAALALSCWPLSAFAADADVSYGDGSNTKVGIRLTAPQINVQAPVRITFGDAQAIEISTSSGVNTSSSVKFVNRTQEKVYLAAADVVQTSTANIGSVFDVSKMSSNAKLTFSSSKTASGQSCTMQCDITNASTTTLTPFAFDGDLVAQSTAFAIEAASSSSAEVAMAIDLMLSFPTSIMKNAAALGAADKLEGRSTSICGIVWTFGLEPIFPEGNGCGSTSEDGGIFLRISNAPSTAELKPWSGMIYNLSDIRKHSRELPSAASTDPVYKLYHTLVTSMDPDGDYECKVNYNNVDKKVWIVGLNQDVAADSTQGFVADSKIGLTFWFREDLGSDKVAASYNEDLLGGWPANQVLRPKLQTGGSYYSLLSIKDSLVSMIKPSSHPAGLASGMAVSNTTDKLSLIGGFEIFGWDFVNANSNKPFLDVPDGLGVGRRDCYLFFSNKNLNSHIKPTSNEIKYVSIGTAFWAREVLGSNFWQTISAEGNNYANLIGLPSHSCAVLPIFCI